jgi:predicted GIY-YIG superfamily endonuclease
VYFVYILRSKKYRERLYIGLTEDVFERIKEHNAESSKYSRVYAPWELEAYISVKNKETAHGLESYLKSGSGFAFLKKRLLPKESKT